jgi:hypothetical protein
MPDKKFLEENTLYKFFETDFSPTRQLSSTPMPSINMFCEECDSHQTFNMSNHYAEDEVGTFSSESGKIYRLKYECASCNSFNRYFLIKSFIKEKKSINEEGEEEDGVVVCIEKVGQYPQYDIEMDKDLEDLLGEHSNYYKRGQICEIHGYGIGAFSYYRRIVEDVIDELLELIKDHIKGKKLLKEYEQEVNKIKAGFDATRKIKLVKDLLPSTLMIEGNNPLKLLYSVLSKGVHNLDDQECLERAKVIRTSLEFLIGQLKKTERDEEKFAEAIKNLS